MDATIAEENTFFPKNIKNLAIFYVYFTTNFLSCPAFLLFSYFLTFFTLFWKNHTLLLKFGNMPCLKLECENLNVCTRTAEVFKTTFEVNTHCLHSFNSNYLEVLFLYDSCLIMCKEFSNIWWRCASFVTAVAVNCPLLIIALTHRALITFVHCTLTLSFSPLVFSNFMHCLLLTKTRQTEFQIIFSTVENYFLSILLSDYSFASEQIWRGEY